MISHFGEMMFGILIVFINLVFAATLQNPFDCWNADTSFSSEKGEFVVGNLLAFRTSDLSFWGKADQKKISWPAQFYGIDQQSGRQKFREAIFELDKKIKEQNLTKADQETFNKLKSELSLVVEGLTKYYQLTK